MMFGKQVSGRKKVCVTGMEVKVKLFYAYLGSIFGTCRNSRATVNVT